MRQTIGHMTALAALGLFGLGMAGASATALEFKGLCEASAGAFIDAAHFAVASDETNVLRVYDLAQPDAAGIAVDLQDFTDTDKSDIEGAAALGERIYWITSHSRNSSGEDKAKRQRFFATEADADAAIAGSGASVETLRDPILVALGSDASEQALGEARGSLNIEGLAAGPADDLLIALRGPLVNDKAVLLPLTNPAALVDGADPEFGSPVVLDLEGNGIRDIARVTPPVGEALYLIVAGPVQDGPGFALWRWDGKPDGKLAKLDVDFGALRPEAVLPVPKASSVLFLSDDGDACSDEDDSVDQRSFRALQIDLPD